MCIRLVERYAVCRCVYHTHSVEPCPNYGRKGHGVTTKETLVGYSCAQHSITGSKQSGESHNFPDSGYGTGSKGSQARGFS